MPNIIFLETIVACVTIGVYFWRVRDPRQRIAFLRKTATALLSFFIALGSFFIIGEAFADPGGSAAVLLTASWVAPTAVATALIVKKPEFAHYVVAAILIGLAGLSALIARDPQHWSQVMDNNGPIFSITVFASALPVMVWANQQARKGGFALILLALIPQMSMIAIAGARAAGGGSLGLAIQPILVTGIMFVMSAGMESQLPAKR